MAAPFNLQSLLEALPRSDDQLSLLFELKTILIAAHPSDVKDVIYNTSFTTLFDCLNTSKSEQTQVACDILDSLLCPVDATIVIQHFHNELLLGLRHPTPPVRKLCLKQVSLMAQKSSQQLLSFSDLVQEVLKMFADIETECAKYVRNVIVNIANTVEGLEFLFRGQGIQLLNKLLSEQGDIIRFRVYEAMVEIAKLSSESLMYCTTSGLIQQLVNEVHKNDVLVQLNCLELLQELALVEHCLAFMFQQGIVGQLETMMRTSHSDMMQALLMPGLIKFFGNVSRYHPKDMAERFPEFFAMVFNLLSSDDESQVCLAVETLGFIGISPQGKKVLENQGNSMIYAFKKMGELLRSSSKEIRLKSMDTIASLLTLQEDKQVDDLPGIIETWFTTLFPQPMKELTDIVKEPFTEIRCGIMGIFCAIALQPWGQNTINNHPGFKEYLLDRSTEKTKEGKEGKYEIIKILVSSTRAVEIFGAPYHLAMREYLRDGPFYVKTEAAVAFEEG